MTTTSITHSSEERLRSTLAIHEAASADRWDTVLGALDPAVVWINDPGAGPWAGRFEGIEAVATMFVEYTAFLGGTFNYDVIDVCASPDRSTSLVVEHGFKDEIEYLNRAVWILRFDGDRVAEVTTVDMDRDDALGFWATVSDGSEATGR